jgi:glyoxylase-like metal-dependent hydrolase (beta-lactamase superfamily II)
MHYRWLYLVALTVVLTMGGISRARAEDTDGGEIRLYTLDCGHAQFRDMGGFSDTGDYDGKTGELANPCFVIKHPKGILVWDTGFSESLADQPNGLDRGFAVMTVPHRLSAQLKDLGIAPSDVTYLAFSHFHFDHTGNANAFPASTWIINKSELAWAESTPTPFGADPATISGYKTAKTIMIDGDHDVFGDGRVVILRAPGHTPGHQVLKLKLSSGTVILAGDLYHLRANRQFRRVPTFNTERADTLASMDRVEKIVKRTNARLVIQHDPQDYAALPKPPQYLH